jgi:ABC-type dipeptide/oligopeptide/nickel transport system permease component
MMAFILRRLLYAGVVLVAVVFFLAVLVKLVPGDAVDLMISSNPGLTAADAARLRTELGLDRSAVAQFVHYAERLADGDFGESLRHRKPVWELLSERLPATLELTVLAMILALLIAVPLGMMAALRQGSAVDYAATVFSVLGVATPGFLVGILLILLFSVDLGWLPPSGRGQSLTISLWRAIRDWDGAIFWASLRYYAMPALSLALVVAAINARLIRSAMLEVLRQDFVLFAKSKGLTRARINFRHVLRNALIPTVTIIGLQLGFLISGAFIIENVFSWPGLGRLAVDAIHWRDYPLIQGTVLLSAVLFVSLTLIVDLLYSVLDPRIDYAKR